MSLAGESSIKKSSFNYVNIGAIFHFPIAFLTIRHGAHFISSSRLTSIDAAFLKASLYFLLFDDCHLANKSAS